MKRIALALAAALVLAPALAQAAVTVKGSDTMVILSQRWAENYMKKNPGKKVQVTGGGSGTGIAALINGTTDIANASRTHQGGREGQGPRPLQRPAGRDRRWPRTAWPLYVNEANGVTQLTIDQLRDIYTGDVTNWKQVGGADAPIVLYSRENSSGTYVFFKEDVLKNGDFAASRADPARHRRGGERRLQGEERHRLRRRRLRQGRQGAQGRRAPTARATLPSAENVKSGKYPLSRPLFVYSRGAPAGEAKAFLDYCLSAEGQAVVTEVGYFPIK